MNNPGLIRCLKTVLVTVFLGLIGFGISLRMAALENRSFFIDELYHVYAADSYNKEGTYKLPSGSTYKRAAIYTYFVSLSFKFLPMSEYAARLPSAVFGFLYLGFLYFLTAVAFGHKVACLSSLLLMFSPLEIFYSSECRMYSLFQLIYALQAFLFYNLFTTVTKGNGHYGAEFLKTIIKKGHIYLILLVLSCFISSKVHFLSLLLYPSIAIYLVIIAIDYAFKKYQINQLFLVTLTLGFFTTLFTLAYVMKDVLQKFYLNMAYTPQWVLNEPENIFGYISELTKYESVYFWLFMPFGVCLFLYKEFRKTSYLLSLFLVPFILLSFHQWKEIRYLYHIYPIALIFVAMGLLVTFEFFEKSLSRSNYLWMKTTTAVFSLLTVFFLMNKYIHSYHQSQFHLLQNPDWKTATGYLKKFIDANDIITTDNSIVVNYYLGRVDFLIDENILDISKHLETRTTDGRWLDNYTKAIHITSVSDVTELKEKGKRIWFLFGHRTSGFQQIKDFIRQTAHRVGEGTIDDKLEVYRLSDDST